MYAVVELQGHQYIVAQDNQLIVDRMDLELGQKFETNALLTFADDVKSIAMWKPTLPTAKVVFEVKEHKKWDKIRVIKFKRKNRYERNFGHRSYQTVLHVVSLNG